MYTSYYKHLLGAASVAYKTAFHSANNGVTQKTIIARRVRCWRARNFFFPSSHIIYYLVQWTRLCAT